MFVSDSNKMILISSTVKHKYSSCILGFHHFGRKFLRTCIVSRPSGSKFNTENPLPTCHARFSTVDLPSEEKIQLTNCMWAWSEGLYPSKKSTTASDVNVLPTILSSRLASFVSMVQILAMMKRMFKSVKAFTIFSFDSEIEIIFPSDLSHLAGTPKMKLPSLR